MNSFRNLADFPSDDVIVLQVYDLLKKTDVATFRHKDAVSGQESLISDELSLNLRNFQMSSTQRNTLVRLESALAGRHWNIWVDSVDYLYAALSEDSQPNQKVEEVFSIVNNGIFELLNEGRVREEVNEKVGGRLTADFRKSLADRHFDRSPIVEKMHRRASRPTNFPTKFNVKTETLSQNETMSERGMHTVENLPPGGQGTAEAEGSGKSTNVFFYVVVAIVLVGVGAVVGYMLWGSPGKEHSVELVKSEVDNGMKNVETNGEQTVVEVQGQGKEESGAGVAGPAAGPTADVQPAGQAEGPPAAADKPVLLTAKSNRITDLGRTLILGNKEKMSEIKKTKSLNLRDEASSPVQALNHRKLAEAAPTDRDHRFEVKRGNRIV